MTNLGIPFQPKYTTCVLFRIMLFCCVEPKTLGILMLLASMSFARSEVPSCHGSSSPTGSVRWGLAVRLVPWKRSGWNEEKVICHSEDACDGLFNPHE